MLYNHTKAETVFSVFAVALLAEGVDRKGEADRQHLPDRPSPSSRRAWIENFYPRLKHEGGRVALLAEGVDRKIRTCAPEAKRGVVALLAEGVDRKLPVPWCTYLPLVALLAEGVDRKDKDHLPLSDKEWSPSSRRAWIEKQAACLSRRKAKRRPPRGGRG